MADTLPTDDQPSELQAADTDNSDTLHDNPQAAKTVDDNTASESDGFFQPESETVEPVITPPKKRLWQRAWLRWLMFLVLVGGAGALGGVPVTRYWILNHAGVRSAATVGVVDEITHQPLQKVRVTVAGASVETDDAGKAVIRNIALGPTTLDIAKPGFSTVHQHVVIGWGSNPFDKIELKAVGVPYHAIVTDWLSGKPVNGARIESDLAAAQSDTNGNAMLILPNDQAPDEVPVTITADGYRPEHATLRAAASSPLQLVTARKLVYVSKQNGTADVWSSDADGQNKQVILAGTGSEGANTSLVVSPDGTQAALVSTRDKQFDADGYPLSSLTLIDIATGNSTVLTHADQIQLIDWIGTRLVFEQAASGGTDRYKIISYDYATTSRYQLAAAAKFNGVLSAQGMVYFAVAPDPADPAVQPYFYRINPDGTGKQTLLEKETWSVYRTGYDTFGLQTSDNWYVHTISTRNNTITSAPSTLASKLFIAQPGKGDRSLWVDVRNGQGVLLLHDDAANKDTQLHAQPGLAYPVRWLTADSAVFRVVTGGEIADYVMGASANRPVHKVADVMNTFGFSTGQ